jgi:TRAP transporter TAXI family solute receptor
LFPYSVEHGHQFVRADSDIKKFTDIKGRRFNMNTPASITSIRNDHMLAAFGMSRKDVQAIEIATSGAFDAIRDKVADMSANGLSIGNASLLELSSSVPIRLISIPEDVFPKFNELMGGNMQYGVIPAGTYNGQTEDAWTFVSYNLLFTHKDTDENIIYEITKAYWEHLTELGAMDSGFKLLTRESAIFGPKDVPLHPGAERYFKEAGLL